jgi:hypothetical protein
MRDKRAYRGFCRGRRGRAAAAVGSGCASDRRLCGVVPYGIERTARSFLINVGSIAMTTSYDPQHDIPRTGREARDADVQARPDLGDEPRTRDVNTDVEADAEARQSHVDPREETRAPTDATAREQAVNVAPATTPADLGLDPRAVVARERAEYGGTKVGAAFFGWLTATGTAVLLTALMAGIGVAVSLGTGQADDAAQAIEGVSLAGAISLIVILFVSYYCGGYVAGRMARFDGTKQGVAVWLWALVIAVIVAVAAAVAGDKFDVLARLNGFPRLPINEGNLATGGIITALALVAASLLGAVLGGLAGVRYHRKVDRVGLDPANSTIA